MNVLKWYHAGLSLLIFLQQAGDVVVLTVCMMSTVYATIVYVSKRLIRYIPAWQRHLSTIIVSKKYHTWTCAVATKNGLIISPTSAAQEVGHNSGKMLTSLILMSFYETTANLYFNECAYILA